MAETILALAAAERNIKTAVEKMNKTKKGIDLSINFYNNIFIALFSVSVKEKRAELNMFLIAETNSVGKYCLLYFKGVEKNV